MPTQQNTVNCCAILTTRFLFTPDWIMQKSALLRALQQEIRRHDFNYFIDEPPSIAQGGKGVVVPGCPACEKRINTMSQFLDHLADDVMPALIEKDGRMQVFT
jgi:hypothetical protein